MQVSAAAGHAAVRHLRSDSQTSSLAPSSGGKSSGSGVPSTPLTVSVSPPDAWLNISMCRACCIQCVSQPHASRKFGVAS